MTNRHPQTSPFLVFFAVILCVICGFLFTSSSTIPSPIAKESKNDMFVAEDPKNPDSSTDSENTNEHSNTNQNSPSPTPTQAVQKENKVWTPYGSNWMLLVNGTPHTGWFTDTDGKRYYFSETGIMQTGWLEIENKKYYFDMDGIMQTGTIVIEHEVYYFRKDGSLKNSVSEEIPANASSDQASEEDVSDKSENIQTETNVTEQPATTQTPKYVALTFDDGPSSFTDRLLDCLVKNNAKATFFFVGEEVEHFPETAKRIADLGFEMGNHTYSHEDLTSLTAEEIQYQISATEQAIHSATGQNSTLLRPPYGSINSSVSALISKPAILWSIDTLDWESRDPQKITEVVLNEVENGSIILMHDIFSSSVDAAEIFIPELIKQGYSFVTVQELADIQGIDLQAGNSYGTFSK